MARSLTSLAVVFDIGGVLTSAEGGVPELSALLGLDTERFAGPYWRHRADFDRGRPAEEYWARVGADLGRSWSPAEIDKLDAFDAERWARLAEGRLEMITALQDAGVTTALLSNAPGSMARVVRESTWSARFDQLLFSCELGLVKPDPRIYRAVEAALGRSGAELVFFDDRPPNVVAARKRGWQAQLWEGPEAARAACGALGLPV